MRVRALGIDSGSHTAGFAVVDESRAGVLTLVDHGVITAPEGASLAVRLAEIYRDIINVTNAARRDTHLYDEFVIGIEKPFAHRDRGAGVIEEGGAYGVALAAIEAALRPAGGAGEPVINEYAPATIKLAVAGHGRADKKQVRSAAMQRLGLTEDDLHSKADASDAIAIAITRLHRMGTQ